MGPFFYSKYEIPANSVLFRRFSDLTFFLVIPPSTTIFFFVKFEINLNLFIPK